MPHHYRVWADEPSASCWPDHKADSSSDNCYSHTIRRRAIELSNSLRLSFNTTISRASKLTLGPKSISDEKCEMTLAEIFDNSLNNKYSAYFQGAIDISEHQNFARFHDALKLWQLAHFFIDMEHQSDTVGDWEDSLRVLKKSAPELGIRRTAPYNDIRSALQLVRRLHFEWYFLCSDRYNDNGSKLNNDIISSKLLAKKVFYTLVTSLPRLSRSISPKEVDMSSAEYWRYYTGVSLFGPVCLFLDPIFKCSNSKSDPASSNGDDCKFCNIIANHDINCAAEVADACKSDYIKSLEKSGQLGFNWHNSLLDRGSSAKFVSNGHTIRVHGQYFDRHHVNLSSLRQSVVAKNRRWIFEGNENREVFAGAPSDIENGNLVRNYASEIDTVTSAMKWRVDEYDYMESVCRVDISPVDSSKSIEFLDGSCLHAYSIAMPAVECAFIDISFDDFLDTISEISKQKDSMLDDNFSRPHAASLVESQESNHQNSDDQPDKLRSPVGFLTTVKVIELLKGLAAKIGFNAIELIKHKSHNVPFELAVDCEMPIQSNSTLLVKRPNA